MDDKTRSRLMARIRSKDTKPELALRRELWHNGLRYRLQYGEEKIDIAFPNIKLAIFVDGCFWHSCPIHGHIPKSNCGYWELKLKGNVRRALLKDIKLQRKGWEVVHFWEHEVEKNAPECARKLMSTICHCRNSMQ